MNRFERLFEEHEIVLGDGAMGTMLQKLGLTTGGAPELWNVEAPEKVQEVHRGYVDAGSMVITTNSFGGTRYRLALHNLQDRVHELNVAAARIAREVAGEDIAVAGSMGPTGELLFPLGTLSFEEARDAFAEQAAALVEGGVDFLLVETMSALEEVQAAIEGIRQAVGDQVPIAVTMTFDTRGHTMMGVSPAQALETIYGWGIRYIGSNCGNGPEETIQAMEQMAAHKPEDVILIAQSNAGVPRWQKGGEIVYDGTPEVMAEYARRVRDLGVRYIGACCGSTPDHIRAMAQALGLTK
ncbi:MAG: betaine--homocysteine S-methyltransferase [Chloroflexi bacterium]|nr:betaine--homocysteine S-methyltransferase [Chloroflexota bacterium]